MQLFEMQGLLAGKCLPGDMKVNESLAHYLLRKLEDRNELERQLSAKTISEQSIINSLGIKGDGPWSKLVIEYVMGLVAENVALKDVVGLTVNNLYASGYESKQNSMHPWESLIYEGEKAMSAPATNAAISEIKASELDDLAKSIMEYAPVIESDEYYVYEAIAKDVTDRAAGLRAGRKG